MVRVAHDRPVLQGKLYFLARRMEELVIYSDISAASRHKTKRNSK